MADYEIAVIHENILNGNRQDAVKLIDEYGMDFFSDYARYLKDCYAYEHSEYTHFKDAVLSYFQIKGR